MIGNLVLLALSVLVLYLLKVPLDSLGLLPRKERLLQLLTGLFLTSVAATVYFGSTTWSGGASVSLNPEIRLTELMSSLLYIFNSVVYEELLFRGVALFLMIRYLGTTRACLLSAAIFGIYHWFSYGIVGQLVPMAFVFVTTAAGGWAFAYAYARTRSLYLPVGLHLGWNILTILIYSQGPLGDQLLLISGGEAVAPLSGVLLFLFQLISLPLTCWLALRIWRPSPLIGTASEP